MIIQYRKNCQSGIAGLVKFLLLRKIPVINRFSSQDLLTNTIKSVKIKSLGTAKKIQFRQSYVPADTFLRHSFSNDCKIFLL